MILRAKDFTVLTPVLIVHSEVDYTSKRTETSGALSGSTNSLENLGSRFFFSMELVWKGGTFVRLGVGGLVD